MVNFNRQIEMEQDRLMIVVGIDGREPPRHMRTSLVQTLKFQTEPVRGERSKMEARFIENLTEDERELLEPEALYAIKVIITPPPKIETIPEKDMEKMKRIVVGSLEENGFNIAGTYSMVI